MANLFICNAMMDETKNIKFTIVIYRPFEPTSDVVCAGDIIKLYHTDHKGYLCAELVTDPSLRPFVAPPHDLPLFVRKMDNLTLTRSTVGLFSNLTIRMTLIMR